MANHSAYFPRTATESLESGAPAIRRLYIKAASLDRFGMGRIIASLGIMIALYPIWPRVSAVGSFLLILMSLSTLAFLVTTPEAWVPALGDPHHGFPYLSGAGRLVVKDCIMLGAGILTMADAAKTYVKRSA